MTTKRDSRIDYIDIFRGVGIILMVMGHVGFGNSFEHFIHAFHMPMFFVISGFLFKEKSKDQMTLRDLILKKTKSLIIPYLFWGISQFFLYLIFDVVSQKKVEISPLLHLFWNNTTDIAICGAIWFLTALYFTDIIYFILNRYIKNKIYFLFIVIVLSVVGTSLPFAMPFALNCSFVGVGLFYIGHLLSQYQDHMIVKTILNLSWIPNMFLAIIMTVLIDFNGYINMRVGRYSIIPLFWINAVLATVVILNFSRMVCPHIVNSLFGKWLKGVGEKSIVYLCLNQLVITMLTRSFNVVFKDTLKVMNIVVLVLSLVILHCLSLILTKTKFKAVIGK